AFDGFQKRGDFTCQSGAQSAIVELGKVTARGGGLVPIAQKLALPIYFIGVGEQADDLQVFSANGFARALVGLEEEAG
ncbi:hypothetical protein N9N22_05835, partial [Alphaproteobacteria bacterium]|nr:hypothetical protein [Alphaproteobacteria bacterium]